MQCASLEVAVASASIRVRTGDASRALDGAHRPPDSSGAYPPRSQAVCSLRRIRIAALRNIRGMLAVAPGSRARPFIAHSPPCRPASRGSRRLGAARPPPRARRPPRFFARRLPALRAFAAAVLCAAAPL